MLLDGRRVVSSTKSGSTDINLFPEALVQRVEVITGGASAAYGSDAVSGVVNFILDTDFTGLEAHAQAGTTTHGQRDNYEVSIAGGLPIGDNGHLIMSAELFHADPVEGHEDFNWFNSWGVIDNPDPNGPQRITVPNLRSRTATYGGLITGGPLANTQFLKGGTPAPFHEGDIVTPTAQSGGSGHDVALTEDDLTHEQDRESFFAHYKHNFTDNFSGYVQAMYATSETAGGRYPNTFVGPWEMTVFQDNAFLDEGLRQRMIDEGIESFPFGRQLNAETSVNDVWTTMTNTMQSYTVGFNAEAGGLRYNGYYQYGKNKQVLFNGSDGSQIRTDRIYRSLDSVRHPDTGRIVCRSTLTIVDEGALGGDPANVNCVPGNFFGDGSLSQEVQDYITGGNWYDQRVKQHFAEFTVQADPFELPAGLVSIVGGLSYREDSVYQQAAPKAYIDPVTLPGEQLGYRGLPGVVVNDEIFWIGNPNSDGVPIEGEFDVKEIFAESFVPLLADAPLANSVDASLALRWAEYSGSGEVWAWKAGIDWAVTDELRIRATRSRDTRAGTLSERFDATGGGGNIDDPFLPDSVPYLTTVLAGGNPNVNPEISDTVTYGFVYQPYWLPGFGISIDYYDIEIEDAIDQLGTQEIVDQCFQGAEFLCAEIDRDPATNEILLVRDYFLNVAQARTTGVDMEVTYESALDLLGGGAESLLVRGFVNYTHENSTTHIGTPTLDRAGQVANGFSNPQWMGNFSANYRNGPWSIFLQERYVGGGDYDVRWKEGVDIDDNSVSGRWYTSLRLGYDFETYGSQAEAFLNVSNLFNKEPPLAPSAFSNFSGTEHSNYALYDVLGRTYTAGIRIRY